MSSKMTRQQAFYRLSKIFHPMESLSTLNRLWSASSGCGGIVSSTISTHGHQIRVVAHPSRRGLRFAVRQEIGYSPGLQID
jgi:hypothetical protein